MLPAPAIPSQTSASPCEPVRPALGERDRADDEQAGEHHPGERGARPDLAARPRGGQRGDRPRERGAEPAENRDHFPSLWAVSSRAARRLASLE